MKHRLDGYQDGYQDGYDQGEKDERDRCRALVQKAANSWKPGSLEYAILMSLSFLMTIPNCNEDV